MGEKGDAVSGQHLFSPYFVNILSSSLVNENKENHQHVS